MLGWMSPYVLKVCRWSSRHCLRHITRFGLTLEGGIWVTCFGVIMTYDLPTTMYFVPFTLFLSYNDVLRAYFTAQGSTGQGGQNLIELLINACGTTQEPRPPLRPSSEEPTGPVNTKSRVIMGQDFNQRNASEPSPASLPFHDRPVEFISPSGSHARESVLKPFRELLERVFNQGIL
ncbi:hypothetical protein BGY98DRAFT_980242 [Russula aff. rugulosa BPL654]|nr:hypothetical protein BGY98DRAFT_980242 [Russula aff. rugulosa BPL654]